MSVPDRDLNILLHMIDYCDQIEEAIALFGRNYSVFQANTVYQNAVAMCLMQIGELSGHLTEEFKAAYPQQPWRQIKALRNLIAHHYGAVDVETAWDIVENDIPVMRSFCETLI